MNRTFFREHKAPPDDLELQILITEEEWQAIYDTAERGGKLIITLKPTSSNHIPLEITTNFFTWQLEETV